MKKLVPLLILILAVCSAGCSEEGCRVESPEETPEPTLEEKEAAVKANSYLVLLAAEEFAAENDGWYPVSVDSDTTESGKTLIDFLPGGLLLVNPFTNERTEPRNMTPWFGDGCEITFDDLGEGETGYFGLPLYCCRAPWYIISGYGTDTLLVELSNADEIEDAVVMNCLTVLAAVEEFARLNNGYYPHSNADTTPEGETLIDLLPGGTFLVNPYTKAPSEPVDGCAAHCGQIGYEVRSPYGENTGYVITGYGWCMREYLFLYSRDP